MNQSARQSYYPVEPKPPVKSSQATPTVIDGTNWAMLLHLSQFAHCIAPLAGVIAPIAIWQFKKDQHPELDRHGKMVCNWMISQFIYTIVAGLLAVFIVGIPLVLFIGAISVIFPLMGAIKASDGHLWSYPLTIKFLK